MTPKLVQPGERHVEPGDLVALDLKYPSSVLDRSGWHGWKLAQVRTITADGAPKLLAEVGIGGSMPRVRLDCVYGLVSWVPLGHADTADIALAAARAHHYAGHPRQPQPYGSLEELRLVVEDAALAGST